MTPVNHYTGINMSVVVYWNEETEACLRVDLTVPWNWREFKTATEEAISLLGEAKDSVGYIVDVRDAGDLPPAGFVTHSRNSLKELPCLPMVFVVNTPIMQIIFQPIQQIFRLHRQFYFVRTLEEAREILCQNAPESSLQ
jgi:hypothetical protein